MNINPVKRVQEMLGGMEEHQLAAMLNVTHRTLTGKTPPTARLRNLLAILGQLDDVCVRGRAAYNMISEPIAEYDDMSLVGMIVDGVHIGDVWGALSIILNKYRIEGGR